MLRHPHLPGGTNGAVSFLQTALKISARGQCACGAQCSLSDCYTIRQGFKSRAFSGVRATAEALLALLA